MKQVCRNILLLLIAIGVVFLAAAPCAVAAGEPYFIACGVKAENSSSGPNIGLDAQVGDPNGTLPGSISSVTVAGPGGFNQTLTEYSSASKVYYVDVPGTPTVGEYIFTVTDKEGKTASSAYYLESLKSIPLPNTTYFSATNTGNPLTPLLSWGKVDYAGALWYWPRIYDMSDNPVWDGGFTTGNSAEVPSGILQTGASYRWRVELLDSSWFWDADNRVRSDTIDLVVTNTQPVFRWTNVYTRNQTGGSFIALDAGVYDPNGDIQSLVASGDLIIEVNGPSGFFYRYTSSDFRTFPSDNFYRQLLNANPLSGVYSFTIKDNLNTILLRSYDFMDVQSIPIVNPDTVQFSGSEQNPVISWGVPEGIDQSVYFRVRSGTYTSNPSAETRVNLPAALSSYTQFQILSEDSRYDDYSNQSLLIINPPFTVNNERPFINWMQVYKRFQIGQFFTTLDIGLSDPNGTVPGSIASFSVTGPNGFAYTFKSSDYDPFFNSVFASVPGKPAAGVYTATLVDNEANTAVSRDILFETDDIPQVDSNSIREFGKSTAPTIVWGGIAGYPGHLYYRVVVEDSDTSIRVFTSEREPYTAVTIPPEILKVGKSYRYRIEAYDHPDFIVFNTRTNTPWSLINLKGRNPAPSLLLLDN